MKFSPLYPLRRSIMKPITCVFLFLHIFLSVVWNMEDANSNNVIPLQQQQQQQQQPKTPGGYKMTFFNKFASIPCTTKSIEHANEHARKLERHGLSRLFLFGELDNLHQMWMPHAKEISDSLHGIHILVDKDLTNFYNTEYNHNEDEADTEMDYLMPKSIAKLIETINSRVDKLEMYISKPEVDQLIKIMPNYFDSPSPLNPQDELVNSNQIDQVEYANTLLLVSIVYNCFPSLRLIFNELKREISVMTQEVSGLKSPIHETKYTKYLNSNSKWDRIKYINEIFCGAENKFSKAKKLIEGKGLLFSQDLYLNICILISGHFNKEDIKAYKKALMNVEFYEEALQNIKMYEKALEGAEANKVKARDAYTKAKKDNTYKATEDYETCREAKKMCKETQKVYMKARKTYKEAQIMYNYAQRLQIYKERQEAEMYSRAILANICQGCSIL